MRTRMALALAAGLLIGLGGTAYAAGPPGMATGFPNGWTNVKAANCVVNHNNLLVVYPAGGPSTRYLTTQNTTWISPLSALCKDGKTFGVYVEGTKWTAVSYAPAK